MHFEMLCGRVVFLLSTLLTIIHGQPPPPKPKPPYFLEESLSEPTPKHRSKSDKSKGLKNLVTDKEDINGTQYDIQEGDVGYDDFVVDNDLNQKLRRPQIGKDRQEEEEEVEVEDYKSEDTEVKGKLKEKTTERSIQKDKDKDKDKETVVDKTEDKSKDVKGQKDAEDHHHDDKQYTDHDEYQQSKDVKSEKDAEDHDDKQYTDHDEYQQSKDVKNQKDAEHHDDNDEYQHEDEEVPHDKQKVPKEEEERSTEKPKTVNEQKDGTSTNDTDVKAVKDDQLEKGPNDKDSQDISDKKEEEMDDDETNNNNKDNMYSPYGDMEDDVVVNQSTETIGTTTNGNGDKAKNGKQTHCHVTGCPKYLVCYENGECGEDYNYYDDHYSDNDKCIECSEGRFCDLLTGRCKPENMDNRNMEDIPCKTVFHCPAAYVEGYTGICSKNKCAYMPLVEEETAPKPKGLAGKKIPMKYFSDLRTSLDSMDLDNSHPFDIDINAIRRDLLRLMDEQISKLRLGRYVKLASPMIMGKVMAEAVSTARRQGYIGPKREKLQKVARQHTQRNNNMYYDYNANNDYSDYFGGGGMDDYASYIAKKNRRRSKKRRHPMVANNKKLRARKKAQQRRRVKPTKKPFGKVGKPMRHRSSGSKKRRKQQRNRQTGLEPRKRVVLRNRNHK